MSILLVTHGTRSAAGQRTFAAIRDAVAHRTPGQDVHLAYVDVQTPLVQDAVPQLTATGADLTVVPVFLGSGYHVHVDIPAATAGQDVTVTEALGPEPELVAALADQWSHTPGNDRVEELILGATGSSDSRSRAQTREVARLLSQELDLPVTAAFCAAGTPVYEDEVARKQESGVPFGVISHLIAPGFFQRRIVKGAGSAPVSDPIGAHSALVDLLLRRAGGVGQVTESAAGTFAA